MATDQSLLSVFVLVYNDGPHPTEAIESVSAQTHGSTEIIVVDEDSVDDTSQAAQSFKEVRHNHLPSHGHGAAKNAGTAAGGGETPALLM